MAAQTTDQQQRLAGARLRYADAVTAPNQYVIVQFAPPSSAPQGLTMSVGASYVPCAQRDSGEPESDLLFMFWWYLYHPSNRHTTSAAAGSRNGLDGESLDVPAR